MDVADIQTGQTQSLDSLGDRTQKLFQTFLESVDDNTNEVKYLEQATNLKKQERNVLKVSYGDVQAFSQELANVITQDYYRVYPYLCRAVKNFVKDHVDPEFCKKDFYIAFEDVPTRLKVRELSTDKIGTLIRISGQVVRTHPVHPELTRGTFTCEDCKTVIRDIEQQFKYTLPSVCPNQECSNKRRFELNTEGSTFVDFQKIRVQETQAELPRGSIPRSLEVVVHAEAVETAQAGDRCDFIGTLVVVPDVGSMLSGRSIARHREQPEGANEAMGIQGLKELGVRDLHYRLAFLACNIQPSSRKFAHGDWELEDVTPEAMQKQMNPHEWNRVFAMTRDPKLYSNLTESLFPTIHGNIEVKQGVLLMLFGGVPKTTEEGTTLRGDINVCIVGDPSTAKSQFLRQVAEFNPRAVYTSGKASSAAGLTAAVVKDEESYEFVIEAGALMLADNGVCCIDEFDKMDAKDQVAIHEAMEQQTISITKAGIKATLNARTSILAAANPKEGKYNPNMSLRNNVNMEAPIISRFDLFFILTDNANEVHDYAIARKIVDLHAQLQDSITRVYTQEEVLRYIMFARQFKPQIGKEAAKRLIHYYKILRQRDTGASKRASNRVTVRQLESMVRISEAFARLHCSDVVELRHVEEAYRLINKSIIRVEQDDVTFDRDDPFVNEGDDEEEVGEDVANLSSEEMDVQDPELDESTIDSTAPRRRPANVARSIADSILGSEAGTESSQTRTQMKLSYDEYVAMSNVILMYMRREEQRLEASGSEDYGLRRSAIVDWYLNEVVDDIDSEAELVQKKELVEKVIDNIIAKDKHILKLEREGLGRHAVAGDDDDPILVVHPNYDIQG